MTVPAGGGFPPGEVVEGRLLREVTDVGLGAGHSAGLGAGQSAGEVMLGVAAVRCFGIAGRPGWLTGEPLADQGIEIGLPNLPGLPPLPLDPSPYALRVTWPSAEVVRITIAPAGSPVLRGDGTWLGIITDPGPGPASPAVTGERDGEVVAEAGRVRARVRRRPFSLAVEDTRTGAVVLRTAERLRQVAGFPLAPAVLADERGTTLHLELSPQESVLGFGEQFGPVAKNGQKLRLRVEDALGTGTGMAYKPVPVWNSTAGYTGLCNTGAVVTADVGHTRPSVLGLTVDDDVLDLYVVVGDSPKDRTTAYTALTGRAPVPPPWAFGLWMGRCRYHSREEMLTVARGMREAGVPCDVLHLDPDWLVLDRLNCDFVWNTERFGKPASFVADLADLGMRLSVWEAPYLDAASSRYAEAAERGYLVRGADGRPTAVAGAFTPDGRPRGLVDVTDPAARRWWQGLHEELLADGVAVFKTDYGEGLPDDAVLADGTPSRHAHNLYPLRYNAAVFEATRRFSGGPALVWGRSGWAGSQRYPGQWAGDAESTVAGMRATLRGGLSYALSAPGLWSHDVGGFFGPELTAGLYVRWLQFGALSPLMRAHGLRPREPWAFGERALAISRRWVRLRYSLLPYLWQVAHEAEASGWPMLRPLGLEYADDPVAPSVDDAFLLGRDLLVVPVFDDGEEAVRRRFYVPRGRWWDLLTGEPYAGPGFASVDVPLERMPVLVRDAAVIARVSVDDSVRCTDDLLGRPWTLHVYGAGAVGRDLVGFDGTVTSVRVRDREASATGTQAVRPEAVRHP